MKPVAEPWRWAIAGAIALGMVGYTLYGNRQRAREFGLSGGTRPTGPVWHDARPAR